MMGVYFSLFKFNFIVYLMFIILLLISLAFLTLFERNFLGYIQMRKGPQKLGILGLLQPFSDMLKLLFKEFFFIKNINNFYYYFSPLLMILLSFMLWFLYPFYININNMNYSMIYLLIILGLGVYPMMLSGWSSNSNYAMLGSIRSISQSVSYEVILFLMLFILMMLFEDYSFIIFKNFQYFMNIFLLLSPIYLMFIISMLVELNRTPFDLIEGESELVSGFNVEYFGSGFILIFMSEYLNIIFVSFLVVHLFMISCDYFLFYLLMMFHIVIIVWIRGVLPRIRYDKLMNLCWKKFLSIVLFYIIIIFSFKEFLMIFI